MTKIPIQYFCGEETQKRLFKYKETWDKKNVSQTIDHIIKSWMRQDEERIRKRMLEQKNGEAEK